MSELTKKILESGLVDAATASLMEKWGVIPEGSAELAKHKELEGATKEQLLKFAEDIGAEVDKHRRLRETVLDLKAIRWPTKVAVWSDTTKVTGETLVDAVIDQMGRYYFRPADVELAWFVPGRRITRQDFKVHEVIAEVTELFVGEQLAAIQVSTQPA